MPKSWLTISFFLSFLAVTTALQWMQLPLYPREVWIVLAVASLLFALGSLRWEPSLLLLCVVLGSGIAFLRVAQTTHVTTPDAVEAYALEQKVTLRGVIAAEPDRRPMKTKYTIEVSEVFPTTVETRRGASLQVRGKTLVTDHAFWPRHDYGDEVLVTGVLEQPGRIEDFHYDRYLSRYGIYSVMYRASVKSISSGHGNRFFAFLYKLKERFESQLNRLYPEPHASFMAGLLTGSRRGIPEHLLKDFQTTGLTHIIAISGYNISIVIAIVSSLLFFLPLKLRFVPAVAAIIFFTFFVGASPSVVRAAIMGALGLFALQVGRQTHSLIAILLTASVMTAWNPKVLWYDAGFQLSFLSVLGLSYLAPLLDRLFAPVPHTLGLRESLQMTVAAQLAAVPLVVVLFGQFSVVAPFANVMVAPLIPLAMLTGFTAVLVSFFSMPLGLLIAFPGWGALELIIFITRFFAGLPHASFQTPEVAHWIVWGYYVCFVVLISLPLLRTQFKSVQLATDPSRA